MAEIDFKYHTEQDIPLYAGESSKYNSIDCLQESLEEEFVLHTTTGKFMFTEKDLRGMLDLLEARKKYRAS